MEAAAGSPDNSTLLSVNLTCDSSYINPPWLYTVIPAYIYTISALGIVLNLLVLVVFLLHKKADTVRDIYLSNMAAANLFLVMFLPFWGTYISNRHIWTFGGPMCKIVGFLIAMNYNCSIFFLVLVSIDRFLQLVSPLSQRKLIFLQRHKNAKVSCAVVWCFGLLLNIPILICRQTVPYSGTASDNLVEYTCDWNCSLKLHLVNDIVQAVVVFIIPFLIISFCNVKIFQSLNGMPRHGVRRPKGQLKMMIVAWVVLLAFLICWLPFQVQKLVELALRFKLIEESCKVARVMEICKHIFASFGFSNSDLNTVAYVIVMKHFHKDLKDVLSRCGLRFSSTKAPAVKLQVLGKGAA